MSGQAAKLLKNVKAGWLSNFPFRHSNLSFREYYPGEYPDPIDRFLLPIRNLVFENRYDEAAEIVRTYESSDLTSRYGRPLARKAASLLADNFGSEKSDIQKNLERLPFVEEWANRRTDCPYATAVYASALHATGYSYRGSGWASSVKESDWRTLQDYTAQAEAFLASRSAMLSHPDIALTHLRIALGSGQELNEHYQRFYKLMNATPYDVTIYQFMTPHLLPRWYGSFQHIREFSEWSADSTRSHLGESVYAAIWLEVDTFEHMTRDMLDWDRFKVGIRDWQARLPSQAILTQAASLAFQVDDLEYCLHILENLTEFHLADWTADVGVELVNSICREFVDQS